MYTDYAYRLTTSDGDFPDDDLSIIGPESWAPNNEQNYDCIIFDGVVRANPSSMESSYVTWGTRRTAVSQFKLQIQGFYQGLWIKLPGLEYEFPNATNGWLDAMSLYDGVGIPGYGNNGIGCAVGIPAYGSGTFICTFGPQNSTFSNNNVIVVRFKIQGLEYLKSLSIRGMAEYPELDV